MPLHRSSRDQPSPLRSSRRRSMPLQRTRPSTPFYAAWIFTVPMLESMGEVEGTWLGGGLGVKQPERSAGSSTASQAWPWWLQHSPPPGTIFWGPLDEGERSAVVIASALEDKDVADCSETEKSDPRPSLVISHRNRRFWCNMEILLNCQILDWTLKKTNKTKNQPEGKVCKTKSRHVCWMELVSFLRTFVLLRRLTSH